MAICDCWLTNTTRTIFDNKGRQQLEALVESAAPTFNTIDVNRAVDQLLTRRRDGDIRKYREFQAEFPGAAQLIHMASKPVKHYALKAEMEKSAFQTALLCGISFTYNGTNLDHYEVASLSGRKEYATCTRCIAALQEIPEGVKIY